MSYDIKLCDPVTGKTLRARFKHEMIGGTYAVGGTDELWLNITWNYSEWYCKQGVFETSAEESEGIRAIYGLSGADSIPVLQKAICTLQSMNEDIGEEKLRKYKEMGVTGYWIPTRSNAIKPLYQLLAMAKIRPDGVWEGD